MDMSTMATEEKFAAKDYKEMMKESLVTRAAQVKALKQKRLTKADTAEKREQAHQKNELTIEEIKHLELYLAQLHVECDFLMRNFENRHSARLDEEQGLESAESIVTKEEVQTHAQVAAEYDSEDSMKQVHQHYPDQEMPV